jgi:hypothetical protein
MYKQFLDRNGSKFSNQKIRHICEETKKQRNRLLNIPLNSLLTHLFLLD